MGHWPLKGAKGGERDRRGYVGVSPNWGIVLGVPIMRIIVFGFRV